MSRVYSLMNAWRWVNKPVRVMTVGQGTHVTRDRNQLVTSISAQCCVSRGPAESFFTAILCNRQYLNIFILEIL